MLQNSLKTWFPFWPSKKAIYKQTNCQNDEHREKNRGDQTNRNLSESVTNLENKLADLESLMEHKFQDLNDDLDKKIADLDDEKADRKKLGKALEKIALMLQE